MVSVFIFCVPFLSALDSMCTFASLLYAFRMNRNPCKCPICMIGKKTLFKGHYYVKRRRHIITSCTTLVLYFQSSECFRVQAPRYFEQNIVLCTQQSSTHSSVNPWSALSTGLSTVRFRYWSGLTLFWCFSWKHLLSQRYLQQARILYSIQFVAPHPLQ